VTCSFGQLMKPGNCADAGKFLDGPAGGDKQGPTASSLKAACQPLVSLRYPQVKAGSCSIRAPAKPICRKPRRSGAFLGADEGTRTLDLLHGKQTL
jgi:hypothetical protein